MKGETINDRIQLVVDQFYNGERSYFARDTNIPVSSLSSILGERQSKPSSDTLEKIYIGIRQFDISPSWLAFGIGEMLETDSSNKLIKSESDGVPFYEDIDVAATITGMYSDNGEIPSFFINYRDFNDCTAYLPVVGDSMYPKYASGEIIAVKQITNREMILWGEAYLVIGNANTDNLRTIKLLYQHQDDDSKLILRASNPNFKGDTIINKEDIVNLFLVKGKIVRNHF